jgi:hypothetical protein
MQKWHQKRFKKNGVALIIFVLALVLAATAFLIAKLDASEVNTERDKKTAIALSKAKIALIGWSITRGNSGTDRPGELPCPDTDAPGTALYGVEEGSCVVGKVGRLPWKTLGIEELTDGYGEPLWYSIDGAFRKRFGSVASTNQPINSDTRATTKIYAADGLTLITGAGLEAAAVILAPKQLLNGQNRSPTNIAICPATGTSLAENRCATNYLDSQSGRSNATNTGSFIRGSKSDTFNDQLIYISAFELMKMTEKRVGRELKTILKNYYTAHGVYPYPAKYSDTDCRDEGNTGYFTYCQSNVSVCRGRFPDEALPVGWGGPSLLPGWFSFNLWGQTIYYSVGTNALATSPFGCSPQLTVDATNQNGIFILSGSPFGASVRNSPSESLNLSIYLEDIENQDGWSATANNVYTTPSAASNDSLFILP